MNPIYKQPDLNPQVISGAVDLFFEKSGRYLKALNDDPNAWQLDPTTTNVLTRSDTDMICVMRPPYEEGKTYQWSWGPMYIDILDARLIRLDQVTEEDAQRTGLEKTENGYRHYCPKKLFPAEVLKTQQPGHPYMTDARGSFFTKWIDKYGVLDVPLNPWIWRYEIRFNINKSFNK